MMSLQDQVREGDTTGALPPIPVSPRLIRLSARMKSVTWAAARTLLILGISYMILLPVLTKIVSSVMTERDMFDQTVMWIPKNLTLSNYRLVWEHLRYPRALLNSFLLATAVSLLQLTSCALVGYGFARIKVWGRDFLFSLVLFVLIVPPQMLIVPLYLNFRSFDPLGLMPGDGMNLLNSVWPFILMAVTATGVRNGLYIYVFRQVFRGMPGELEEAAYVDGAGMYTTFARVMLPGALPSIVIVFLFSFVWQWNEHYLSSVFMGNADLLPIRLSGLLRSIYDEAMDEGVKVSFAQVSLINNTGSLLFIAPLLVLYAVMQRYFVESIERTGIVG